MYGRKVYWFKLLYELALNSGCDYLTPGPVHYREDTSPHHYAERPFSPRRLYSLTPSRTKSSVFMIEGGRPCRPCVVHSRLIMSPRIAPAKPPSAPCPCRL